LLLDTFSTTLHNFYTGITQDIPGSGILTHNQLFGARHRFTAKISDLELFLLLGAGLSAHASRMFLSTKKNLKQKVY
jgi:putative endonuclease